MQSEDKIRWYDLHPHLRDYMEKLKDLKQDERNKIILAIKDLIMNYNDELISKHVPEFSVLLRRRWYDKDPFSWLVMNALSYADKDLITNISLYLKDKL